MTISPAKSRALRAEFPADQVGKLPRVTCLRCRYATNGRCDHHDWINGCIECGGAHTSAVIHLDYVGHANVTARLLEVDRAWSWEPLTQDLATGAPLLDDEGNLWIRLTVCGVTRLGVGDGPTMKERIGDAIRNAAMRFGVALDLWAQAGSDRDDTPAADVEAPSLRRRASGTVAALDAPGDQWIPTGDIVAHADGWIPADEAFIELGTAESGRNLRHLNTSGPIQHETGPDCPCGPVAIPHAVYDGGRLVEDTPKAAADGD